MKILGGGSYQSPHYGFGGGWTMATCYKAIFKSKEVVQTDRKTTRPGWGKVISLTLEWWPKFSSFLL